MGKWVNWEIYSCNFYIFFNDFLIFSPCPDARSLHCIDKEATEATALQKVQGVDGGAPWWAHIVLQLAGVLLRLK